MYYCLCRSALLLAVQYVVRPGSQGMVSDVKVSLVDTVALRRAAVMLAKERIDAVIGGCLERAPLDTVRSRIIAWPEYLVSSHWWRT